MATLDSFNNAQGATLDSFQFQGSSNNIDTSASNKHVAAQVAALSGGSDSVAQAYLSISSDLDLSGTSALMDRIHQQAREEAYQASQADLISFLGDPNISDEQRKNAIDQYMDLQNERYSLPNLISNKALLKDNGDETVESENSRINLAGAIEEMNASKRAVQHILNAEENKSNPSTAGTIADMLELMAPFAESVNVGEIQSQLRDGDTSAIPKAIAMMGSSRAELRDSLRKMPPENRAQFAQKIADAINDNSQILLQDQNDLTRLQNLRTALDDSYYGTTDEWVDNALGWLDIASLGFPIASSIVGAFRRGRAANRAAELATQDALRSFNGVEDSAEDVTTTFGDLGRADAQPVAETAEDGLRAAEDASEARLQARREAFENDPVRRGEEAQEARAASRRALYAPDDALVRLEDLAEEEAIQKRRVRTRVAPSSLSQNYKDTNPTMARAANEVAGQSEEGAQALYGTSRTEAVANDELPEIAMSDGSVRNKVAMPDRSYSEPAPANPRILNYMDNNGMIYYTEAEKLSAATRVVNDFNNAVGMVTRKEMNVPVPNEIGSGFDVNVTYGPKDNGWSNGQEAMELVRHSLRDYAIDESNITLLRRAGDEYKPVNLDEAGQDGDYLVQIKYPYRISAKDIDDWDDLDVVNNFLDRRPHLEMKGGSLQRHLLDAHSMLSPTLTKGATASVARGAGLENVLLDQVKAFGDKFRSLPKGRQSVLGQIIKEQNLKSKVLSPAQLKAMGVSDKEREVLRSWKEVWDNMYWLENRDMAQSLRNRGFQILEDPSTNSRLFGKPVARNQVGDERRVYDLAQGRFVVMTDDLLKDLYDDGGTLFQLRGPIEEGGEMINRVIARNKPGNSSLRGIRDDDRILNYREGYYTVHYTAPKFVEKIVRDANGNELYRKAVATAGDTKEAELYASRLRKSDGGEYVVRNNVKTMSLDSDDNWALQVSSGRTAQRIRGERLEDTNSPVLNASSNHIMGPVDSAIVAARSVATRVSMRDFLESAKARAIAQYGEMFPKNAYGQPMFPGSSSRIISRGREGSKRAADARTTVEYINYLENGYINSMDEMLKAGLSSLADVLGTRGLRRSERLVRRGSEVARPTALGKNLSFTLYLALNPARQFIVQAHQALQLVAIEPVYASTRLAGDMSILTTKVLAKGGDVPESLLKSVGRSKEWADEAYEAMQSSGILAQIDKQNLVRGSITQLAEDSRIGGKKNPISRGIGGVRKIGFDAGEAINQMTAFLTFFHRAKRANGGKKLTAREIDNVTSEAINYTYNMNRAGDMPYNENALGLIFQFMQVAHKALTQMITNRILTPMEKARVMAFNGLMYGAPTSGILYAAFGDLLPQDGEAREIVTQGLESYILNKLLTMASGEETDIDFQSSLLPADAKGLYEFATNLMTTDIGEIVASTPAGGLFLGSNPRITDFIRSSAELFHFVPPADPMADTTTEFFHSLAGLASGTSNVLKAHMIKNAMQVRSSTGDIIDEEVSTPEVYAQILGMQPADVRKYWEVTMDQYKNSEEYESDLRQWYTNLKKYITREGITKDELDWYKRVNNAIAQVYGGDPDAIRFLRQQMRYDAENDNYQLQESVMKQAGWDPGSTREMIRNLPNVTDEERQALLDRLDVVDKAGVE